MPHDISRKLRHCMDRGIESEIPGFSIYAHERARLRTRGVANNNIQPPKSPRGERDAVANGRWIKQVHINWKYCPPKISDFGNEFVARRRRASRNAHSDTFTG
jgi:hypothetical protein